MYKVEINQTETEIKSKRDVRAFVKQNGMEFEPNVELWGLDETITSSGRACLYEVGDKSDTIAGTVTRLV